MPQQKIQHNPSQIKLSFCKILIGLILGLGATGLLLQANGTVQPVDLIKFLLFVVLACLVPCLFLIHKISPRNSLGENILLALSLGYFGGSLIYYVCGLLHIEFLYFVIAGVLDLLALIDLVRTRPSLPEAKLSTMSLLFLLIFIVIFYQWGIQGVMFNNDAVITSRYGDMPWHFSYAAELRNHIPPENPLPPGKPYVEHHLASVFPALLSKWLGLPLMPAYDLTQGYNLALLIVAIYLFAARLFGSQGVGLLAVVTLFMCQDAGHLTAEIFHWFRTGALLGTDGEAMYQTLVASPSIIFFESPGQLVGLLGTLTALIFLMRYLRSARTGEALLMGILMAAVLKIKNPDAYMMLAGLGLTALFYFIRDKSLRLARLDSARLARAFLILLACSLPFLMQIFRFIGPAEYGAVEWISWHPFFYVPRCMFFFQRYYPEIKGLEALSGAVLIPLYILGATFPHWICLGWLRQILKLLRGDQKIVLVLLGWNILAGYFIYFGFVEMTSPEAFNTARFAEISYYFAGFATAGFLGYLVKQLAGKKILAKTTSLILLICFGAFYVLNGINLNQFVEQGMRHQNSASIREAAKFIRESTPWDARVLIENDWRVKSYLCERKNPNRAFKKDLPPLGQLFSTQDPRTAEKIIEGYKIGYCWLDKGSKFSLKKTDKYLFQPVFQSAEARIIAVIPRR